MLDGDMLDGDMLDGDMLVGAPMWMSTGTDMSQRQPWGHRSSHAISLFVLADGARLRFDSGDDSSVGGAGRTPSDVQDSIDWSRIALIVVVIAFGLYLALRAVHTKQRQQRNPSHRPIGGDRKSGIDVLTASRWLAIGAALFVLASQLELLGYDPFLFVRRASGDPRPNLRLSDEPFRPQMFFLPVGALVCSIFGGLTRRSRVVAFGAGLLAAPTILVVAVSVELGSGLTFGGLPIALDDLGAGFLVAVLASTVAAPMLFWLERSMRRDSAQVTTSRMWCWTAMIAVLIGGTAEVLRGAEESVPYAAESSAAFIVAFLMWVIAASAASSSTSDGMAFAGAVIATPLFFSA